MLLDKPNGFEIMLQQKRQETDLHRERELENGHLYAYEIKEKDIPITPLGKNDARSLSTQIRHWKETLTDAELMFVNLNVHLRALPRLIYVGGD